MMYLIRRSRVGAWAVVLAIGCLVALLALPMSAPAADAAPPPRPLSDAPWGADVRVPDDLTGTPQLEPSIAVDPNGNAYAVWHDYRSGTHYDIYFSYRPAGGGWQTNDRVDDDGTGRDQKHPSIAVDPNGNAYAVWHDYRSGTDWDIYFSYRAAGGDWQTNAQVNDDAGTADQLDPSIAVDPSGNAYAVWHDNRSGTDYDIYFSYRPAGGDWQPNVRVDDDAGTADQFVPSIAVDPNGNAYAVWHDHRDGDTNIYFSYRPAGGDWQTNVRVDDDGTGREQKYPSIAVDPCGTAYAVWQDYRNVDPNIYFSYRPAGGDWQPNVRVNDDGTGGERYYASIAVDPSGNAYAVWHDWDGRDWDIYFSYLPAPVPCVTEPEEVEEEFVPEWGSIALLGSGLAGLAGYAGLRWRKG